MQLTDEQLEVVHSRSEALRVVAFAGAGKTATLREYAAARPSKRLLYLAFNKAIAVEATTKFPGNVKCMTTHALAFQAIGRNYRHKLAASVRPDRLASALDLNPRQISDLAFAKQAMKTLQGFLSSPAPSIEDYMRDQEVPDDLSRGAKKLWAHMIEEDADRVPMLHDGYLKLYQLQSPALGFDAILFDEAQDANPVTLEILRRQQVPRVFVGDPHQQIYQFRNAVNAMSDPLLTDSLYLTESFRFGQNIASVANDLLRMVREPMQVKGGRRGMPSQTDAFIARGNAAVFRQAASFVEPEGSTARLYFAGGLEGYRLDLLLDIWRLSQKSHQDIRDPFIRGFKEFDQLRKYAERTDERDISAWINLIKNWDSLMPIPMAIHKVQQAEVDRPGLAGLCLSTAHKSKGLEFGTVTLAGDFPEPHMAVPPSDVAATLKWKFGPPACPDLWADGQFAGAVVFAEEELNLQYVAATRAEGELKTSWGEPPLAARLRYITQYPSFLRADTEHALLALAGYVSEVSPKKKPTADDSAHPMPAEEGPRWAALKWQQDVVDVAVARYADQHPQWSWRWIADAAQSDRSDGQDARDALVRLEDALRLERGSTQLRDFLTECGILDAVPSPAAIGGVVAEADVIGQERMASRPLPSATTVKDLVLAEYGVVVEPVVSRFRLSGWSAAGLHQVACPGCGCSGLAGYRKPYTTTAGNTYHYWALVCLSCRQIADRASLSQGDQRALPKIPIAGVGKSGSQGPGAHVRRAPAQRLARVTDLEPGVLVVHHAFGTGVVQRKYETALDTFVEVAFDGKGTKPLSFQLARLALKS